MTDETKPHEDPARYIGVAPEKVDISGAQLGIDRMPTPEEFAFLQGVKNRFSVQSEDFKNDKNGIRTMIDSLEKKA